jgi:hypothetical protein
VGTFRPALHEGSESHLPLGGDSGLVSIRWDGTDQKRHLRLTAPLLLNQEKPSAPERARMGVDGEQAMIQSGYDVYVVTVPQVGGDPPVISIADPKASAVPARRLTEIGGEFTTWSADGKSVLWAMGSSLFSYNLDSAAAFDRRNETEKKAIEDDTTAAAKAKADSISKRQFATTETPIVVRVARDIPQGTVVLRGARVITMKGPRSSRTRRRRAQQPDRERRTAR